MLNLQVNDYEAYCFDEAVAYFDVLQHNEMIDKHDKEGGGKGSGNALDTLLDPNLKLGKRK